MHTDLLYQDDIYLREFEATVLALEGHCVALDHMASCATVGGQPHEANVASHVPEILHQLPEVVGYLELVMAITFKIETSGPNAITVRASARSSVALNR